MNGVPILRRHLLTVGNPGYDESAMETADDVPAESPLRLVREGRTSVVPGSG